MRSRFYLSFDLFGNGLSRNSLPSLKFHFCCLTYTIICGVASRNKASFAELNGRGLTAQQGLGVVLFAAFLP